MPDVQGSRGGVAGAAPRVNAWAAVSTFSSRISLITAALSISRAIEAVTASADLRQGMTGQGCPRSARATPSTT